MRVSRKLFGVFLGLALLSMGVSMAFAILAIRGHLYEARLAAMGQLAQAWQPSTHPTPDAAAWAQTSGYHVKLVGPAGPRWVLPKGVPFPQDAAPPTAAAKRQPLPQGGQLSSHRTGEWLFVYRTYPPQAPHRYLVLAYPTNAVREALWPIRWTIYYGMFMGMGLVGVLAWVYFRRWTRPVRRMRRTADRLAAGDLTALAQDAQRKDELGDIARALNALAELMREDYRRLTDQTRRQRRFYADITHEVGNPLQALSTSLEMLDMLNQDPQPDAPAERQRYLAIAQNQATRLARLFRDLKLLEQLDSDPYYLHPIALDVAPLLRQAYDAHQPNAQEKGLALNLHLPQGPLMAQADPHALEQVLDNLLTNAIKYTQAGTVALRATNTPQGLAIAVEDTGVGVDPQHLPRLTERFYRADAARSRDRGGTGLGLAIVQRLLQAHGTALHLASTPGQGTTCRFVLPLPGTALNKTGSK